MSPRKAIREHAGKIGAGGIVAALAGVVTLLTMVADLNGKLATSQAAEDSYRRYVSFLDARVTKLERLQHVRSRQKAPELPQSQGLVRRVFHLIF
jgi:hypothetical protein